MASAASFVVSLVDKVTGPAKAAGKQIAGLTQQFNLAKTAADRSRKAEEDAWRAMGRSQDKQGKWREANGRFVGSGKGPKGKGLLNNLPEVPWDKIGKQADAGLEKITTGAKYAAIGVGAIGTAAGVMLAKGTIEMALFKDSALTAFTSLTGSVAGGQQAWLSSLTLARQMGMGVEDVANSMKHLLAMQFKLPEAEEMIRMSADLKAVTGDAHAAERALVAITQIKAKGKVQQEELTGQLAEAGVSTSLVYAELMKTMHLKSPAEVMKAITAGKVDADTGIAAIKAAILHKTHSDKAGSAGGKFAQTTYAGLLGQLKNAPQFLFERLGDSVAGNLERFKPLVQKILGAIDGIQGDQMSRFVGNVLSFMEKLVPLGIEFAKGFGEGFSAMNDAMGGLDPSKASLESARDLGHAMASAFEMAFKAVKLVADMVLWLDQHRGVAAGVAGMLAIDRVAGAGATAKGLYSAGKWAVGKTLLGGASEVAVAGAAGGGTTGLAALTAGLGTAGAVAGGAALAGVGAAAAGYAYREEIANWMLGLFGRSDQVAERGLGPASPTGTLQQVASLRPNTNNQVRFESTIHIDGTGSDPNQIARNVGDQQRGMLEQFFQSTALESGATG